MTNNMFQAVSLPYISIYFSTQANSSHDLKLILNSSDRKLLLDIQQLKLGEHLLYSASACRVAIGT